MVGHRSKKLKLSENPEEAYGKLILSLKKLRVIQDSLEKINDEASDKIVEIEQKYNEIRKPVYDKRNQIINSSFPDFWSNAFLAHPTLSKLLNKEDQKIFEYLSSLEVEDNKDIASGYTITLNFNQNPYFEDSKLSKTYTFLEQGTSNITTTPIRWKEGKGIPNGVDHEKNENKWPLVYPRFLSWFFCCDEVLDSRDEAAAKTIKDDLWSYPLIYFNNGEFDEKKDNDETDDENWGGLSRFWKRIRPKSCTHSLKDFQDEVCKCFDERLDCTQALKHEL